MGRSEGIPNNKFDEAVKLRRKGKKVTEPQLRDEYAPIFRTTLKQARDNLPKLHEELRPIIAERKILCLSDYSNNIQMWAHYADCHTGAVIEFSYIEEGKYASAWGAARAVRYVPCMPLLADEEAMFLSVTQQKSLSTEDHFLNVVYSKARDWSYEHEWRVLGGFQKGVMTEDIPFRAKEVTAVILGCRMPDADRKELLDIIAKKYAHVTVKIARKAQRRFELEFLHVA
jgi:hypothetical protein